jgi:hypothetical protein
MSLAGGDVYDELARIRMKRNAARAALIDTLTDVLGAPLHDPVCELDRFWCPVCGGGQDDRSLFPYRPLAVAARDGRIWCDASLERGYGPATCVFTPKRLAQALAQLTRSAA